MLRFRHVLAASKACIVPRLCTRISLLKGSVSQRHVLSTAAYQSHVKTQQAGNTGVDHNITTQTKQKLVIPTKVDIPQGQEWVGDLIRNGWGSVQAADGSIHEGGWKNGKPHGPGKLTDPQGRFMLEGQWNEGKMYDVQGWLRLPDGIIFEGTWMDGKRHGPGRLVDEQGNIILEAEWKDDEIYNGRGRLLSADGSVFEGSWKNGVRHGPGTVQLPDGHTFEGTWVKGMRQGPGRVTDAQGNVKAQGEWRDDFVYNAQGVFLLSNHYQFHGSYVEGVMQGPGKMVSPKGKEHIGEWIDGVYHNTQPDHSGDKSHKGQKEPPRTKQQEPHKTLSPQNKLKGNHKHRDKGNNTNSETPQDKPSRSKPQLSDKMWYPGSPAFSADVLKGRRHAQGTLSYLDGTVLEGEIRDGGIYNGKGTILLPNDDWYAGGWLHGCWHGPGKITYADGRELTAVWKHGKMVEETSITHTDSKSASKSANNSAAPAADKQHEPLKPHKRQESSKNTDGQDGVTAESEEGERDWSKFTGQGTRNLPQGQVYSGAWVDGQWHGQGKLTREDGTYLQGEFRKGSIYTGRGSQTKQGDTYNGSWLNGRKHGRGKLAHADGTCLEGEFRGGRIFTGRGSEQEDTGVTYSGSWVDGRKHGRGTVTYRDGTVVHCEWRHGVQQSKTMVPSDIAYEANGLVYRGDWQDGKCFGEGSISDQEGNVLQQGYFKNGILYTGRGTVRYPSGIVYSGSMYEGQKHGQGKLTHADGTTLEGEFKQGLIHNGQGTLWLPQGGVFCGSWVDGQRNGPGKLTYQDGTTLEGDFKDGRIHTGYGRVWSPESGSIYEGEWRKGKIYTGITQVRTGDKMVEMEWINGVNMRKTPIAAPKSHNTPDVTLNGSESSSASVSEGASA